MEIVIKPRSKHSISFAELWEYRELFYFLALRDIKVRYKQTLLGILWAILQPLITMVVFTIFFNKIIGVSSGKIPYAVFSFSGLIFWDYFSAALQESSNSLISNQSIITKVFFPRIIIPISSTIVPLVDFFSSFIMLLLLLLFFHVAISSITFLCIIPLLFFSIVTVIGLGGILSIVNVTYRDVRYALPFFIQLLLFVTPVIYPIQKVSKTFQLFLYINPMTGIIDVMRSTLFSQSVANVEGVMISTVSACIIFLLGSFVFSRYERGVADVL